MTERTAHIYRMEEGRQESGGGQLGMLYPGEQLIRGGCCRAPSRAPSQALICPTPTTLGAGLNGSQLQPGDHPQWKRTTSPKVMSPLSQGQPTSNHGSVSRNRDLTCFPEGNNSECPTQPKVPMGSAEVFVNVTEPNLGPVAHEHESQSIDAGLQ